MLNIQDTVQLSQTINDVVNGYIKSGSIGYIKDIQKSGSNALVVFGNKTVLLKTSNIIVIKKARQKRRYKKRK